MMSLESLQLAYWTLVGLRGEQKKNFKSDFLFVKPHKSHNDKKEAKEHPELQQQQQEKQKQQDNRRQYYTTNPSSLAWPPH